MNLPLAAYNIRALRRTEEAGKKARLPMAITTSGLLARGWSSDIPSAAAWALCLATEAMGHQLGVVTSHRGAHGGWAGSRYPSKLGELLRTLTSDW